jgi:hypothetical protein
MRSGELEGAIGVTGAPDNEQNVKCAKAGVVAFAQASLVSSTRRTLARPPDPQRVLAMAVGPRSQRPLRGRTGCQSGGFF